MLIGGLLVPAVFLAATAGAGMQAPSGDRCTVTGTGKNYTAIVTLPANGVEQGAFAFGAPGSTILKITSPSGNGTFSKQSPSPRATVTWSMNQAAVPGAQVTAALTTSGPVPGSFWVVPSNRDGTAWFDPVVCQHPKGTPVPSNNFTPAKHASYSSSMGMWREVVTVPGPGKLIYVHKTLAAKGTPSPLIRSGKASASYPGKVTLMLKPTAAGTKALKASGAIEFTLNIEFAPTNGKPANKVVRLRLTK
jgi:hypothetical protein